MSALWEREIYEGLEIVKFIQIALSSQHNKEMFMFLSEMLITYERSLHKHFQLCFYATRNKLGQWEHFH